MINCTSTSPTNSSGCAAQAWTHAGKLQRRLAELNQQIAQLSDHLLAMDPAATKATGFYDKIKQLAEERERIESDLAKTKSTVLDLPDVHENRERAAAEFDHLEEVSAGATVEEKRELIACYVHQIKADPGQKTVHISLYPTLLSQK